MTADPPPGPTMGMQRRDFALVFSVALLLRWLSVFELRASDLAQVPVGDARGYIDWARSIAAGDWLGSEVFYQAPLYPYFLGACFRVFGEGWLLPRLLQGALGALACGLLGGLATRMAGSGAGRIAGYAAALYSPWIWHDGLLQKTSLGLFLIVLLFYLCERLGRGPEGAGKGALVLVGVVAGLLSLTRENAAILVLPCAWYVARCAGRKALFFSACGLALALLPVGLRNAALGGSFLPTASNVGVNLYIGNAASADGFYVPLLGGRGHTDYEAADARRFAEAQSARELTPGEVSGFFASAALDAIRENPLRSLGLLGRKLLLLLNGEEYMDAVAFQAYRRESLVLRTLGWPMRFWLVLPLAALGLVFRPRNRLALLLILSAASLLASLLPFFVTGRFRMGLVPLLLPFVGVGWLALRERFREDVRTLLLPLGLGLGCLIVTLLPLRPAGDPVATSYANVASELLRQGEYERAQAAAERGLQASPSDVPARFNLGLALKFLGRPEDSEKSFMAVIQTSAAFAADAWAEIASLHAMRGNPLGAERALGRSLSLDPGHDMAHYYRGLLRRQEGQLEEARAAYRQALTRRPGFSDARHNLAHVELASGRADEAIASLIETLERAPGFLPSLKLLALLLATHPDGELRDGAAALRYADRALALAGEADAELWATRAFALAELGRFEEAVAELDRARSSDLDPARWDAARVQLLAGKPFHVDPVPRD